MSRAISLIGFGGIFLMISPKIRESLAECFQSGANRLDQHSPWSYVAVCVALLLGFMIFMSRASAPR